MELARSPCTVCERRFFSQNKKPAGSGESFSELTTGVNVSVKSYCICCINCGSMSDDPNKRIEKINK